MVKNIKTLKGVCAIILTVALLCGLLPVVGTLLPATNAEASGVTQFVADFAELNNKKSWSGATEMRYSFSDPTAADATSVDRELHNWMNARFDSYMIYTSTAQRTYFSQLDGSNSWFAYGALTTFGGAADAYRGLWFENSYKNSENFWYLNTLTLKHGGEQLSIGNFEATVQFAFTGDDNTGGMLFGFHEDNGGQYPFNQFYTQRITSGSTLTIASVSDGDAWKFHNKGSNIGSQTLDAADANFGKVLNGQWYTLTVKALNGTATFTLTDESGARIATMTKTYSSTKGAVSLGFSSRDAMVRQITLVELDDNGLPVDIGTYVTPEYDYDAENTVVYDFETSTQLNEFDTWFVPTVTDNNTAISTTGTANTNWYVEGGTLRYKTTSLWKTPTDYHGGVQIEGQNWLCDYASVYNSNMGIAVLKNKEYKNFILDFDFTGSYYWTTVGFGAKNAEDGVFWTTQNGGYSLFLESSADNKGSADFYYLTAEGLKTQNAPNFFDYDPTVQHHMRVTVTNGKAYMSVDDQPAWVVDVPTEYDGGYIFFALNNTVTAIDNVQVVDLDAKEIVITELVKPIETVEIDRAAGDSVNDLTSIAVYGLTADGYEYPLWVDFTVDDNYRSYKDTTFLFDATLKPTTNVSLADGIGLEIAVVNKVDYDATTSRKYYFDHPNDLKDFSGYYSKPETSEGYWSNENDTGSDEEKNRKWSAYDGELVSMDGADRQWFVSDNAITTNYWGGNDNASAVMYMRNLSTLLYNDHTLTNFRMEYDVKKGANSWWYNYSLIGVQDPTKYVYQLHKYSASLSTGEETSNKTHDDTKDAGVYAFLEQEGYFNIFGNIQGGGSDRVDTDAVTIDGDAYDFIKNYEKDAWHHITIEVVNGIMKWTVDDSFTLYYELDYNAYGGYVGLGTYGTYSQFDNFQITALDAEGNAVNMDTAEQSGAKTKEDITKPDSWTPSFKFDWN